MHESVRITQSIATGLAKAYARGIVHRNFNPVDLSFAPGRTFFVYAAPAGPDDSAQ
jgi:hypothetical protein